MLDLKSISAPEERHVFDRHAAPPEPDGVKFRAINIRLLRSQTALKFRAINIRLLRSRTALKFRAINIRLRRSEKHMRATALTR